jgi:hypothetical protein
MRHRAVCDENELERSAGGERPVGEEAMRADCYAVADEEVEHRSEEHVADVDASAQKRLTRPLHRRRAQQPAKRPQPERVT